MFQNFTVYLLAYYFKIKINFYFFDHLVLGFANGLLCANNNFVLTMFQNQFYKCCQNIHNPLFIGCGGGSDILGAIPFIHHFQKQNKTFALANITWSNETVLSKFKQLQFEHKNKKVYIVDPNENENVGTTYPENYIPEYWLARAPIENTLNVCVL